MTESEIKTMLKRCAELWPEIAEPFLALVKTLTPREEAVIKCLYGIGCEVFTHKVLARQFRIRIERVEQIRDRALRKIAHPARWDALTRLYAACELSRQGEIER